jgi:hypothetical protein
MILKEIQHRIWFQNNQKKTKGSRSDCLQYDYTCYSGHYDTVLYPSYPTPQI